VGDDQVQHLELAREIARRWNGHFGGGTAFFAEPEPILSPAKRIMGLDGQAKMSKSLGNTIAVTESPEQIWDKLRPAMTDPARKTRKDPGTPEICNVYALHRHFSPEAAVAEVAGNCRTAGWGCIDCKRVLADNMIATLAPLRERTLALAARPDEVTEILADGAEAARNLAHETMSEVSTRMGFLPEGQ
jgi:tryptophanyl-tRNA synthetase